MRELFYIFPEPLPSGHARTTTVVKSCAHFQHHFQLTLVLDSRTGSIGDIERAYGVDLSKVKLLRLSKRCCGISSNQFFNRRLREALPKDREILVFVRHLKTADALLKRRSSNWRIIFEAHELFYKTAARRKAAAKLFAKENYIYSNADAIVSTAGPLTDDIKTDFSPTAPTLFLPTATEVPHEMPRKDFGQIKAIHYIGGLMEWKGVDTLIKAYASVDDLPPLEIVGSANPARVRQVREHINQLGLLHKIHLRGHLPHAEVERIMASETQLCVIPNSPSAFDRYSVPLKLFEYMGSGNIIVYSRTPTIQPFELRGTIGVGVTPGSIDELAEALQRVCNDPLRYAPLAGQAFELVQEYSWFARTNRFVNFVEGL